MTHLLGFLGSESGVSVRERNVQLSGALDDGLSGSGANVVGDLPGVGAVLHEKQLDVLEVGNEELLEAGRQSVSGSLVAPVSDVWLWPDSAELSPLPSVDTAWMSPALLDGNLPVGLVALELASNLLGDLSFHEWLHHGVSPSFFLLAL
eukprot:CAMPEP_0197493672 /NCGR_PEP_ID=MMETSP1311-20131121/23906_1 /TAXON_ID=464262 /ORGANISM="Genus nov. species nov., Strain RCC856" /LENGTH=148 /DNA_ID=CAMNT_0043038959 /DNA_START=71 /DNA_END=514 /DNA_ORIENTATION=-